jgi:hypothetical protein
MLCRDCLIINSAAGCQGYRVTGLQIKNGIELKMRGIEEVQDRGP